MQRDCRMCRTEDGEAKRGGWTNGGRLLPPSRIKGTKGSGQIQTRVPSLFPSPIPPRGPFSFLSPPCFLPQFLPRCCPVYPVNVASHVVSEGFCESADDCRRVIRRFLVWRQLYRERKGAGSDGYGTNGREREMRSRFATVRSPLRCCARRAQRYKWPRRYAYSNRPKTRQRMEEKKKIENYLFGIYWLDLVDFVTVLYGRIKNNWRYKHDILNNAI